MKTMNYSLVRIVCALIIGLVLVLWPDVAVQYLVITLGVLFLIPGLISLISYFGSKPEEGVSRRFPMMFLLGFILILGGVQQIASLSMARRWTIVPGAFYVVPSLILLAGIVALFNPTGARNTAFMIIGISSLVYAVSELINWFKFTRRKPQKPVSDDIEDAKIIE